MEFDVHVDDGDVSRAMRDIHANQLPFAEARAVLWTANDFQRGQYRRMADVFTLRRPDFARRSVKMRREDRPTKQRPEATVRIESPGGRSDIFAKFEADRIKGPFRGRSIAVPTDNVPRSQSGVIPKFWRPSALLEDAQQVGRGPVIGTRGNVYRGKVRKRKGVRRAAFLIRKPGGRGTIFERDADELIPLYQLVPRVSIDPVLGFERTARRVVAERWGDNFTRSFNAAVASRAPRTTGAASLVRRVAGAAL